MCAARSSVVSPPGGVGERDLLLGAAIYGVAQLESLHAVVVRGPDRHRHFFQRGDLGVAPGLLDANGGTVIFQRLDDVLHRAGHGGSVFGHQVDPIEPVLR